MTGIIFKIEVINSLYYHYTSLDDTKDEEKEKEIFEEYKESIKRLSTEIQNIRIQLRKDFGKMLGVN